jgi:hypothetical protein
MLLARANEVIEYQAGYVCCWHKEPISLKRVCWLGIHEEDAMTIRIAAIEVSHWHALNDAAYLRHLIAMSDVELVAIQDSDASLVARRAAEVGSPPTSTNY